MQLSTSIATAAICGIFDPSTLDSLDRASHQVLGRPRVPSTSAGWGDCGDAGIHEPGASRFDRSGCRHPHGRLLAWGWCSMSCWSGYCHWNSANSLSKRSCGGCGKRPVMAHPAGAAYRARKYIRRHRIGAGVGPAAIATILVLAVVLALANFARHQNEIERIRWTLQQAIDNPNKWLDLLQPYWSHLESILHDEIRKNPH